MMIRRKKDELDNSPNRLTLNTFLSKDPMDERSAQQ